MHNCHVLSKVTNERGATCKAVPGPPVGWTRSMHPILTGRNGSCSICYVTRGRLAEEHAATAISHRLESFPISLSKGTQIRSQKMKVK